MRIAHRYLFAILLLIPVLATASENLVPAHVVQAVIDDPKLQPFFHFEDESRSPLIVVASILEPDASFSVSGKPAVIAPPGKPLAEPHLLISAFEVQHDVAIVRLQYKIEGVEARFIFTRNPDSTWRLRVSDVWERCRPTWR